MGLSSIQSPKKRPHKQRGPSLGRNASDEGDCRCITSHKVNVLLQRTKVKALRKLFSQDPTFLDYRAAKLGPKFIRSPVRLDQINRPRLSRL